VGVVGCGPVLPAVPGSRGPCLQSAPLFPTELSPPPPPPPVVKKPLKASRPKAVKEDEAEPAQEEVPTQGEDPPVHSSNSAPQHPKPSRVPPVQSSNSAPPRPQPSREIRNIIRMYQSRPGPVAVPVQPTR
jgi:myosin-15